MLDLGLVLTLGDERDIYYTSALLDIQLSTPMYGGKTVLHLNVTKRLKAAFWHRFYKTIVF